MTGSLLPLWQGQRGCGSFTHSSPGGATSLMEARGQQKDRRHLVSQANKHLLNISPVPFAQRALLRGSTTSPPLGQMVAAGSTRMSRLSQVGTQGGPPGVTQREGHGALQTRVSQTALSPFGLDHSWLWGASCALYDVQHIPGPYSQDAPPAPGVTTKTVSRRCHVSLRTNLAPT